MFVSLFASSVLLGPVTALCSYGGDLYVGSSSGIVYRLDEKTQQEEARYGVAGEPVRFITASPYGLAWLCGGSGSIRERTAPAKPGDLQLFIKTAGDSSISRSVRAKTPVRRLSWLHGRVALCYDFGADYFNVSGHSIDPKTFFPASATGLTDASLFVRELADRTELAVFARPTSVRLDPQNQTAPLVSLLSAYQVGGSQWISQGGVATTALDAFPDGEIVADESGKIAASSKFFILSDRIAVAEDGIVARESDALLSAPVMKSQWETTRVGSPASVGDALWFGATERYAWSWNGQALVSQSRATGEVAAFFPWEDVETPSCFAVGSTGLWVGRNSGIRRVAPDEPSETGGMILVKLDQENNLLPDSIKQKLTAALFGWRFADTAKAGDDGAKMVAGVFSSVGITLPTSSQELQEAGKPVRGDLQYGDLLIGPNRCAVYIGNGSTVELRAGKIGNGSVWSWSKAMVRRVV